MMLPVSPGSFPWRARVPAPTLVRSKAPLIVPVSVRLVVVLIVVPAFRVMLPAHVLAWAALIRAPVLLKPVPDRVSGSALKVVPAEGFSWREAPAATTVPAVVAPREAAF